MRQVVFGISMALDGFIADLVKDPTLRVVNERLTERTPVGDLARESFHVYIAPGNDVPARPPGGDHEFGIAC